MICFFAVLRDTGSSKTDGPKFSRCQARNVNSLPYAVWQAGGQKKVDGAKRW